MFHFLWCLAAQRKGMVINMSNQMKNHFIHSTNSKTGADVTIAVMDQCANIYDELYDNCKDDVLTVAAAACSATGCMDGDYPYMKAISTCAEGDMPCVKVGENVAEEKLALKYHKRMARDCEKAVKLMQRTIDALQTLQVKHCEKAENIQEDLEKIFKGGEL